MARYRSRWVTSAVWCSPVDRAAASVSTRQRCWSTVSGSPIGRARARAVASPVLEVGPAFASADAVREDPPGGGPLAAVVAGWDALGRGAAQVDGVLVLAVDLPFVERAAARVARAP